MKKALVISAIASSQGKTLVTMALLRHFSLKEVRPFKIGPDFIDPQFHKKVSGIPSVNLDGFMMNESQVEWIFNKYKKDINICEGVMGFYDGMDKKSSAYDIARILNLPTLLILDGGGSYITVSAVLKGLIEFRDDNTIKAVVLNYISSQMHFELIKKHIELETKDIVVIGWIGKNLQTIKSRHLGLDLDELEILELDRIADEVLENIDISLLENIMQIKPKEIKNYPFKPIIKEDKKCVLVNDINFSFLYYDNLVYLREVYREVLIIDSTKDDVIPKDADIIIIVGGYVETNESYNRVKNSNNFRDSLIFHSSNNTRIYAECAGLIYLGESIDDKKMSRILPLSFKLENKRERLGYYKSIDDENNIEKGHAFHYSKPIKAPKGDIKLYKISQNRAIDGGWVIKNIKVTYLHTMWRCNINKI